MKLILLIGAFCLVAAMAMPIDTSVNAVVDIDARATDTSVDAVDDIDSRAVDTSIDAVVDIDTASSRRRRRRRQRKASSKTSTEKPNPFNLPPKAGAEALASAVAAAGKTLMLAGDIAFVKNDNIQNLLPTAPVDYPEPLQGMIWMDQSGSFGVSTLPSTLPDLALSFGDIDFSRLDPTTRTVNVDVLGPAWQWENNEKGFHSYDLSTKVFSHYEFVFSEAYDFAQIYPHVKTFFGSVRIPKDVLSFTLTRQNPPAGACPPAAGATKQEISRCAMWRRDSTFFKVVPGLSDAIGTFVYYAYQIVDNERRPIEPYYSAYLAWANSKCKPDKAAADKYGYDTRVSLDNSNGLQSGTSFLGRRQAKPKTKPAVTSDKSCVKGVCQVTSIAEVMELFKMNEGFLKGPGDGPAPYFWSLTDKNTGKFEFAGDTDCVADFARVKKEMQEMPARFHNKTIFKANDLGLLRLNTEIFTYPPSPYIGLSLDVDAHAKLRPFLDQAFGGRKGNDKEWTAETFKAEAAGFLKAMKAKGELKQEHLSVWTQLMLHKYGLKKEIGVNEAASFATYVGAALKNAILPKEAMVSFTKDKLNTAAIRQQNEELRNKYASGMRARFPNASIDDDLAQLWGHGMVDGALSFAGGLSIPGLLTSMIGILFSGEYGDFSKSYATDEYIYETIRYLPAVVGVPWVEEGTTRRQALALPAALADKKVWGESAFDFKLRDKKLYEDHIDMAWSGFLYDDRYPGEEHTCPGLAMSKAMLKGFMSAFKFSDWYASEQPVQKARAPVKWNSWSLLSGLGPKKSTQTAPSNASNVGADVFWNGKTPLHSRIHQTKGFATEMLFSYDMKGNGITVNKTHIFIPLHKRIQSSYIRRQHGWEDEEVGVALQKFMSQRHAVFGPDVTGGVVEKMHGFWRKRAVDTTAYERAMKEQAKDEASNGKLDGKIDNNVKEAIMKVEHKHQLVTLAGLAANGGFQSIEASGIVNKAAKAFANDGAPVTDVMRERADKARAQMQGKLGELSDAQLADPLYSFVNCFHWEFVKFTETHAVFPLNTKIGGYRGQTAAAPFAAFDVMQGVTFWSHDADKGTVEVFYGASVHGHFPDIHDEVLEPAGIYHGPASGVGKPVPIVSKVGKGMSKAAYMIYKASQEFPNDYKYLYKPHDEICPPERVEWLKQQLPKIAVLQDKFGNGTMAKLEKLELATFITKTVPCVANLMKPDQLNGAKYDLFMNSALAHAVVEVPAHLIVDLLAARDFQKYTLAMIR